MQNKIEEVLDEYVRPELAQHAGNVELISCENGVVRLKMTGRCAGCPAADITNEQLITKMLKQELPQIQKVELAGSISEDLLSEARRLLYHQT